MMITLICIESKGCMFICSCILFRNILLEKEQLYFLICILFSFNANYACGILSV